MQQGMERFRLSRRAFLGAPIAAALAGSLEALIPGSAAASAEEPSTGSSQLSTERRKIAVTSLRTFEEGFHNGPTTHFDRLDPEDFMRRVRDSHAECVVVQAKSLWGYAYYDTKAGVRHPGLSYDLVARMLDAAHSNGLAAIAYYSGQVDVQSALKHPEWVGTNADGSPSWYGEQFPWCCHHSPYGDYTKKMYAEIFSKFDFDGLFIDGAPWPRWFGDAICCCPWCEAKYLQQTSESLRPATNILMKGMQLFAPAAPACRSGSTNAIHWICPPKFFANRPAYTWNHSPRLPGSRQVQSCCAAGRRVVGKWACSGAVIHMTPWIWTYTAQPAS